MDGFASRENSDNYFVHRLKSVAYSYNTGKDSLFVTFQFDHVPLLRPHYNLSTEPGIIIEFHGTILAPRLILNDAPRPILDIGFNEYNIGRNIVLTKVAIYLEFSAQYNLTNTGNLMIIGIKLPEKYLATQSRNKKIEKLKPNKLMSYSHTSTPAEMEVKLKFKRIYPPGIH